MIRQLAVEYWQDVERVLVEKYDYSPGRAQEDARLYQERLRSHGVTDLLYHWDPENIAASINGGRFKLPPPRLPSAGETG